VVARISTSRTDGSIRRRIPQILPAELSRADESGLKEMTSTENVSPQGVRVTTVRRWQTGTSRAALLFSGTGVRSEEGRLLPSARRAAASPWR